MARKNRRRRSSPKVRTRTRTVVKYRTRRAPAARRSRRRSSSSSGGLPFRQGRNVLDTVKGNLPTVAGLAVATTAGAIGAGYLARKIAPRVKGNPLVVGGIVTFVALLVGAAARKIAGKAGGAVGPKAVSFAALGAATQGLATTANALRARFAAPSRTATTATLPAGGAGAVPARTSAEALAQLA